MERVLNSIAPLERKGKEVVDTVIVGKVLIAVGAIAILATIGIIVYLARREAKDEG